MPKNTQADVEKGMVTPQKERKVDMVENVAPKNVSPAKTEPMSPGTPITIDIKHRGSRSRGILGMTRMKSIMVVGTGLGLAGGLAYFLLEWFEIPGLSAQIDRLEGEVNRLAAENNRYEALNDELNSTVGELKGINIALNDTATRLEATNQELGSQVADLEQQNQLFKEQNGKLSKSVHDLRLISNFLNDTATELNDSVEQISAFLADQIASNQAILLNTLENTYRQRKDGWNCDYNIVFGGKAYTQNYSVEIPTTDVNNTIDYVSNRVLDELCFDRADFKSFLELPQYSPLTSFRLNAAVTTYAERALDWYFPEADEDGLTQDDWAAAKYDCEKLEKSRKYRFSL